MAAETHGSDYEQAIEEAAPRSFRDGFEMCAYIKRRAAEIAEARGIVESSAAGGDAVPDYWRLSWTVARTGQRDDAFFDSKELAEIQRECNKGVHHSFLTEPLYLKPQPATVPVHELEALREKIELAVFASKHDADYIAASSVTGWADDLRAMIARHTKEST